MKLKIGVLGAGHLGKIHLNCISQLSNIYELVGFFDPDTTVAKTVHENLGYKRFKTIEELVQNVDVVDIVTPTLSHFECAQIAIKHNKHIFVEKPITNTIAEAEELIGQVENSNIKAQVGHVERFNPAYLASQKFIKNPMFIESHRLAEFNPRGTDVSVVMDLMIHDIDIVLNMVQSPIKAISASGVGVVSETADICNARLEFENGCVANLTASRISLKNMRKSRFFQKDAYISIDFLTKTSEIVKMTTLDTEPDPFDIVFNLGEGKPKKKIEIFKPEVGESNAIKEELDTFAQSIENETVPIVPIEDGEYALSVALQIMEKLKLNGNLIKENI